MILHAMLWKTRKVSAVNKRWLHLEDSMVCLLILPQGRTSSHLQPNVAASCTSNRRHTVGNVCAAAAWARGFLGEPHRCGIPCLIWPLVDHMPRPAQRVLLAGRTARERRERRAGYRLRDFCITPKTRARYEQAVGRLLPFLERQSNLSHLDDIICE